LTAPAKSSEARSDSDSRVRKLMQSSSAEVPIFGTDIRLPAGTSTRANAAANMAKPSSRGSTSAK
jgi:hypothetical protein